MKFNVGNIVEYMGDMASLRGAELEIVKTDLDGHIWGKYLVDMPHYDRKIGDVREISPLYFRVKTALSTSEVICRKIKAMHLRWENRHV